MNYSLLLSKRSNYQFSSINNIRNSKFDFLKLISELLLTAYHMGFCNSTYLPSSRPFSARLKIFKDLLKKRNMKAFVSFFACLCMLSLWPGNSSAQNNLDSTLKYRIETLNGNEYIGKILSQDSAKIYFSIQDLGAISISRAEIKKMEVFDTQRLKNGKYWFENPQSSRYFWAPNGYGLKSGEAYFQNVWVFYNQASVGVTDNFSIGAGMIPLFLFAGTSTPVWVVPKVSIPLVKDRVNLGIGAIAGTVLGVSQSGFGIVYGVSTFGSHDNNASFGLGYGFAGGNWAKKPLINISGMARVSSGTYLITENYIISFSDNFLTLISIGGRSIVKRSVGIDYGLVFPINSDIGSFFGFPWLGITIPMGKSPQPARAPVHRY